MRKINYIILKFNYIKVRILPNPPETLPLIACGRLLNAAGKGGRVKSSSRQLLMALQHHGGRAAVPGEPGPCRRAGHQASCFPGLVARILEPANRRKVNL